MTRRVVVTGGAGFIGSALVRHLVRSTEYEVLNIDKLTYAGNLESLREITGQARYRFAKLDICDAPRVRKLLAEFRPSAIVHLAAESHVDRSINGPKAFVRSNVVGTCTLLMEALRYWEKLGGAESAAFRFHHVSTDEVFGELGPDGSFTEASPYRPNSPYAASKAAADHFVRAWARTFGLPVVLSNCSNNYGPYQYPEKLIPLVIIKCLAEETVPVYGKGEQVRDWLYVSDHVRALQLILENGKVGESYNVGGAGERRNIDVVYRICDLLDRERPLHGKGHRDLIRYVADRPGHDYRYAIDFNKLSRTLGWQPRETFETGLERTVRWYLDNAWWWQPILARSQVRPAALRPRAKAGPRLVVNNGYNVLVTGAGGQIGRALLRARWPKSVKVVGTRRQELDVACAEQVDRAIAEGGFDAVVNAAAHTAVDEAEHEMCRAFAVNHLGALNLARACARRGTVLVHFSTDYVFDGAKPVPYLESDPVNPVNMYGRSKVAGEKSIRTHLDRHIILRTSRLISSADDNFISRFLRLARQGNELAVAGAQTDSPTSASDIAAAVVQILMALRGRAGAPNGCHWGTYHCVNAEAATWYQLAEEALTQASTYMNNRPALRQRLASGCARGARRPANSSLDCGKLDSEFGIRLRPWREALAPIVAELMTER